MGHPRGSKNRTLSQSQSAKRSKTESSPGSSPNNKEDDTTDLNTQLAKIQGDLFDLQQTLFKTNQELSELKESNRSLKEELQYERHVSSVLQIRMNQQEQYSRKNNVLVFGVRDTDRHENATTTEKNIINIFKNKLGIDMLPADIQAAHRLGKFLPDGNRPIIVQFVNRKAKLHVLSRRKNLRGQNMAISEDLTQENLRRLSSIKNLNCVTQAWSSHGRLFAKNQNEKVKEVKPQEILSEHLFDPQPPRQGPPQTGATALKPLPPQDTTQQQQKQQQQQQVSVNPQLKQHGENTASAVKTPTTVQQSPQHSRGDAARPQHGASRGSISGSTDTQTPRVQRDSGGDVTDKINSVASEDMGQDPLENSTPKKPKKNNPTETD